MRISRVILFQIIFYAILKKAHFDIFWCIFYYFFFLCYSLVVCYLLSFSLSFYLFFQPRKSAFWQFQFCSLLLSILVCYCYYYCFSFVLSPLSWCLHSCLFHFLSHLRQVQSCWRRPGTSFIRFLFCCFLAWQQGALGLLFFQLVCLNKIIQKEKTSNCFIACIINVFENWLKEGPTARSMKLDFA